MYSTPCQHYPWVPKELTAQFMKACPAGTMKRSGNPVLVALVQVVIRALSDDGGGSSSSAAAMLDF